MERYRERVLLCHMNMALTQPMAFPRGLHTFAPSTIIRLQSDGNWALMAPLPRLQSTTPYRMCQILFSKFTKLAVAKRKGVFSISRLLERRCNPIDYGKSRPARLMTVACRHL